MNKATCILLSIEQIRKLKQKALDMGTSMSKLIGRLVDEYLSKL